jgi:hypothetical protein
MALGRADRDNMGKTLKDGSTTARWVWLQIGRKTIESVSVSPNYLFFRAIDLLNKMKEYSQGRLSMHGFAEASGLEDRDYICGKDVSSAGGWGPEINARAFRRAVVPFIASSGCCLNSYATEHGKEYGAVVAVRGMKKALTAMMIFTTLFGKADASDGGAHSQWGVSSLGIAYGLLASALFLLQSVTGISAITLGDGHRYPPRLLIAFLTCRRSARVAVLSAQGISVVWAVGVVTASKGENALAVFLLAMVLWIGPGESAKHWKMVRMTKHEKSLLTQLRNPYTRMRDHAYLEGLAPNQRNSSLSPGLQVRVWNDKGNQLTASRNWQPADYGWIRQFTGVGPCNNNCVIDAEMREIAVLVLRVLDSPYDRLDVIICSGALLQDAIRGYSSRRLPAASEAYKGCPIARAIAVRAAGMGFEILPGMEGVLEMWYNDQGPPMWDLLPGRQIGVLNGAWGEVQLEVLVTSDDDTA